MHVPNFVDGVERRGNVDYLRWRVVAEFRAVVSPTEINQSLKTRDEAEARVADFLKKNALRKVWKARSSMRLTADHKSEASLLLRFLQTFCKS